MPKNNKAPDWMGKENSDADSRNNKTTRTRKTVNSKAPQLIKSHREPSRKQKNFYIQDNHAVTFEKLVFDQRQKTGITAPELAEMALEMLFKKYKMDVSNL